MTNKRIEKILPFRSTNHLGTPYLICAALPPSNFVRHTETKQAQEAPPVFALFVASWFYCSGKL
jgi:hypothetical protein